jgi:ADP-heptose:LPS heptosyltransferase
MYWYLLHRKMKAPEKKILVVRFSSIGDIVLTSPVVRCLKKQLPDYEIHFLTKIQFAPLVLHNPNIDKVYTIEREVNEVTEALRSEGYEYIIDLHNNLRSRQVAMTLKYPKVLRLTKPWFRRWLYIRFKWKVMPGTSVVDRYFNAVKKLGVTNDQKGLDCFIPKEEEITAASLPFTHLAGYVALVVGAAHFTKRMPNNKLEQLCRELPLPIILIGGPEDAETGYLLEHIDPLKISNACGRYSLLQSASLVSKAKWVITPDTGMMHIAVAFNRKIVSVWGSTTPQMGFAPYLPQGGTSHLVEANGVSCRPCHKHGQKKCPKGHFNCMMQIDPAKITSIIGG